MSKPQLSEEEILNNIERMRFAPYKDFYIKEYISHLEHYHIEEALDSLKNFLQILEEEHKTCGEMKNSFLCTLMRNSYFLTATLQQLTRNRADMTSVFLLEKEVREELSDAGTVQEANDLLLKLVRKIFDRISAADVHTGSALEIRKYIDYNIFNELFIEDIAQYFHMTPETLNRRFKKETGQTISSYIMSQKVRYACYYLKSNRLSIAEIAQQLHFFDSSHFAKVFKKYIGISPIEFRKRETKKG